MARPKTLGNWLRKQRRVARDYACVDSIPHAKAIEIILAWGVMFHGDEAIIAIRKAEAIINEKEPTCTLTSIT